MRVTIVFAVFVVLVSASNAELILSYNENTDVSEVFDVAPSTDFFIGVLVTESIEIDELEFFVGISGPVSYTGLGTLYPAAPSCMELDDSYGYGWIHAYLTGPLWW